jgi:polyisoprenoid-binding protein YceI
MRSRLLTSAALLVLAAACSSEIDDKPAAAVSDPTAPAEIEEATDSQDMNEPPKSPEMPMQTLQLDPAQSKFEFVGAKVTGDHRGTFGEYKGALQLDPAGNPAKLDIEVATASLKVEPEKLQGHLQSEDFLDVAKYPTAKFTMEGFQAIDTEGMHQIKGLLDLHGVQKQIEFPAKLEFSDAGVEASAQFTINRKDFGIVYPGKPDDLIKDDVLLDLALRFPKS